MKTRIVSYFSLSLVALGASSPAVARAQDPQDQNAAPPAAETHPAAAAEPPPASAPEAPAEKATEAPSSSVTLAGPTEIAKDEPQATAADAKESKLRFRNSTLLFDQSVSTQTAHVETSPQQSYVPFYEWWLSFRPRYYFTDKLRVQFRFDYYKEFTNSEQTTKYRQDVFGDIWSDLIYSTPVPAISKNLRVSAGLRALWPTSKESQASGIYITGGLTAGANYKIPLRGESAKYLNSAHVATNLAYTHPFSQATTPVDTSFIYTRQDAEGRSFLSNQVRGGTLTNHQLLGVLDTGIDITPKLALTLDMILINKWHYAPKTDQTIPVSGGSAFVPRSATDTQHTVDTWFIASVDYELIDDITLGLGYYNLANELAPNGQRRGIVGGDNIWWSPDARIFFDITANLDRIYERVAGIKDATPEQPKAPQRAARVDRLRSF